MMLNFLDDKLNFDKEQTTDNKKFALIIFLLGIFLLPSSIFLGLIFLLPACIIGILISKENFLKDKYNLTLIICSILMVISTLINIFNNEQMPSSWKSEDSWIGIFNWIPMFFIFWGSQPFLDNSKKRRLLAYVLVSGSIPLIITGLGQYFFNWNGPFETLNGLIIWYQREIKNQEGLSGFFNHANYAGCWLNIVLPFGFATVKYKNKFFYNNISKFILLGLLICILLTNSRSAWIGSFSSTFLLFGISSLKWLVPILSLSIIIIFCCVNPIFGTSFQIFMQKLIPDNIWLEFTQSGFKGLDISRLGIWKSAINHLKNNLLWGTGHGSFSNIFLDETGFWKGHSHNLFLELSINYGLLVGLILTSLTLFILFFSFKISLNNRKKNLISIFDKALVTSLLVLLMSQMVDIQYFDGRIAAISWVILAGAKNI